MDVLTETRTSDDAAPPRGEAMDPRPAIARACERIAPLWPLRNFVAVNPFLGFTDQDFASTCAAMARIARTRMLMPRSFYADALARGEIVDRDLSIAIDRLAPALPTPIDPVTVRRRAGEPPRLEFEPAAVVATVAEVLDGLAAGDRHASLTAFMIDEISKWCAAYFDQGQSVWRLPTRGGGLYAAWRASMCHDLNPEMMGVRGFRQRVAEMPSDPIDAICAILRMLEIPDRAVEDYIFRALFDIRGWAAYVRHIVWREALAGRESDLLVQLLAIRVVWGYTLFASRTDARFRTAWAAAMAQAARLPADHRSGSDPELALDLVLHEAFEVAGQRLWLNRLAGPPESALSDVRPRVQAAFCIDVRSEVFRRALEAVEPGVQTLGFAGFFGFPIEYVPIGAHTGGAQCPVLLAPSVVIREGLKDTTPETEARVLSLRQLRRCARRAWKAFKLSAVSCFTFVEAGGVLYAAKLFSDGAGLTRPVQDPNIDGLDAGAVARLGPRLEPEQIDGRAIGLAETRRIDMAEAVLRGMSLLSGFSPLVLLIGHGSTTVNNPHASSLDCGACGGHTGEANARVAAGVLNDPAVRDGLAARGVHVPPDTWFVAGLHDTTTDAVELYDVERAPKSHRDELHAACGWLAAAAARARRERAPRLGLKPEHAAAGVKRRSRDWAQVRPEWGLAGASAFIAAPRRLTRGLDLQGRAFLHDYDWRLDPDRAVLELILTAPMVVASWINLQYYGSSVNNAAFGAGDKALHNVCGAIGVLEGNGGDLKTGLPWQSVHTGQELAHAPRRLSVFVAAPFDAITVVIARREDVRRLVDNQWVHLFAMDDAGRPEARYGGKLGWKPLE